MTRQTPPESAPVLDEDIPAWCAKEGIDLEGKHSWDLRIAFFLTKARQQSGKKLLTVMLETAIPISTLSAIEKARRRCTPLDYNKLRHCYGAHLVPCLHDVVPDPTFFRWEPTIRDSEDWTKLHSVLGGFVHSGKGEDGD